MSEHPALPTKTIPARCVTADGFRKQANEIEKRQFSQALYDGVCLHSSGSERPGSLGLRAMQERIAILDGAMTLQGMLPSGLPIQTSLPLISNMQSLAAS